MNIPSFKQIFTAISIFVIPVFFFACASPVAHFSYKAEKEVAPAKIHFINESTHAINYHWDFGNGVESDEAAPVFRFDSSGNYVVKLIAQNRKGKSTFEQTIQVIQPSKCLVNIVTSLGTITVELFEDTPLHRDNFIKLVKEGFYNHLLFHRVIAGFMIQGGDPDSKNARQDDNIGSGGPGYMIPAEISPEHVHIRGALAAARTGDDINPQKKSSGSQFYLVQGKKVTNETLDKLEAQKGIKYSTAQRQAYLKFGGAPQLDMEYTVFGQIIDGFDVLDKITQVKVGKADRPIENIEMKLNLIN